MQRRFSKLMGRLGCSRGTAPGVYTHCPLQSPFLWEFLLNAVRMKEIKGDLVSTTVNYLHGMTVVKQLTLIIAGDWLSDVCKHTNLQLEQMKEKKPKHVIYFSHAGRRLSSKSNFDLTS